MPFPASQVTFKVPGKGPVTWDNGSRAEPVVRCCMSDPDGCMCQKYVSGVGRALTLQFIISFMSVMPLSHSGGSR